jgi:hypothetical protein
MVEVGPLPEDVKITDEAWQKTPPNIRRLVMYLVGRDSQADKTHQRAGS